MKRLFVVRDPAPNPSIERTSSSMFRIIVHITSAAALTFVVSAPSYATTPQEWLACAAQIKQQLASGENATAIQTIERCQSTLQPTMGKEYLVFLNNAGHAYGQNAQTDKAIQIATELLTQTQRLFPPKHRDVVDAKLGLAVAYMYANDPSKALPLLLEADSVSKESSFSDRGLSLRVTRTVATAYDMLGDVTKAVPMARRALETAESMQIDPQELTFFQTELGLMLRKTSEKHAALPLLLSAYQVRKKNAPSGNYDTANAAHNLAVAYKAICNLEASERLFAEAYAWRLKNLGEFHPATIRTKMNHDFVGDTADCKK